MDRVIEQLNLLLPAYINGTLNPVQRKFVALWLERDEAARRKAETLRTLQSAVQRQPKLTPSAAVFGRIQAQIQSQQPPTSQSISQKLPNKRAALGVPVLLLSLITFILAATLMWQALPPGIVLQWSVEGQKPEVFRVYRAEVTDRTATTAQFELLEELPAVNAGQEYTFTDFRLLPSQNYLYRVEGLDATGRPAVSQTISGQGIDALPGQLAILLLIGILAYACWQLLDLKRPISPISI